MPSYNPNSIWDSKEKKYSYNPEPLTATPKKSPSSQKTPEGPSFFHRHKVTFSIIGILLAAGLVGLVVYLLLPAPAPNIAISFSEPSSTVIGEAFPFSITVSNESNSVLKNAQLNIMLPPGISFVGQDPSQRVMTEQIDTLSSQTINPPQNLQLIATGNPGTSQTISVTLTYQTAATDKTQYETDASTSLVIGQQPAITLSYGALTTIFSGQNFPVVVNYQNNTANTLQNVQVQMQYPPAYSFSNSSIPPINAADDEWNVGTLGPNATGTFTLTGDIVGPTGVQYQLSGMAVVGISGENYPLNPVSANFLVAASPLSLTLKLNNSSTYVAGLNDNLNYTVTFSNNSDAAFQTLNIQVTLVGQMYNFSSLQTTGSFNSNTNTITWNAANTPQLLSLDTGQGGSVNFSINTKSAFPIRLPSDKNYILKATAQIESPTVPPNTVRANKVVGEIALASNGYLKEPTAGITNTGPYPPVVGKPTQYTIHWDITSYSTDAQNVTVSAYLQSGTTFTGQIKSNVVSSTPVYNPATGEITWTIPLIPATTGVISSPAEAVFQVTNTPSVTQVGQNVTLLGPTSLSSTDAFTGAALNSSAPAITTQLQNDQSITTTERSVTQ
jgi:uncharacterized repeat protein (TIGR01451 family)